MAFEVKEDVQNLQFLILVLKSWIVILNLIQNGKKMKKLLTTRKIKKVLLESSILGLNIYDALVLKNCYYSKKIGDHEFKKFKIDIKDTENMNKILSKQLDFRKQEFRKLL